MSTVLRSFLVCIALGSLIVFSVACGGSGADETASGEDVAGKSVENAAPDGPSVKPEQKGETTDISQDSPEAAIMKGKFKEMAATEGIYFGEVPEGFPLEFIPVHPEGEIDKSSTGDGDFTLLQNVAGDKDSVFAWFKDHFEGLGWSVDAPFTMGDRTMIGVDGRDATVSMTLIEKDGGKTFVALVLSPR